MPLSERKGLPTGGLRQKRFKYYLNDYGSDNPPRLRIEFKPGGKRCLCKDITTMTAMEETKRYLWKEWDIKA